jgi:TRAP-type mannitol/chloroaromatic compound transport system permease small subunit
MGRGFCRAIDTLNEWVAKATAWLFIPLAGIVAIDVALRFGFNRPLIWSWDINSQILCVLVILSGGWTLLKEGHVRVDVLWNRLSSRKKAVLDLITFLLFFFAIGILLWQSASAALVSVQTGERYSSYFAPPIYPLKIIIVLGIFLLLLQGIVKFIRDLSLLVKGGGRP